MKTVINSKANRAGIKFVSGIVPKRHTLPILGNVHLYANGAFQVTATDLDITLSARLDGKTEVEGKTTLPAVHLVNAVSGAGDVELETNDKHITTIRAGAAVRAIHGLSHDEFPACPVMSSSAARLSVPADLFISCLKQVEQAMSTDESRYVLNGVNLEITAEQINFIATDGRRLHTAKLPTGGAPVTPEQSKAIAAAQKAMDLAESEQKNANTHFENTLAKNPPTYTAVEVPTFGTLYRKEDHYSVTAAQKDLTEATTALDTARAEFAKLGGARTILLPAGAVKHLLRLPLDKKNPGQISIASNGTTAEFVCGIYTLTSKQIEGNYPNYKQVIPAESKMDVAVNIGALRECLAVAEQTTSEKSNSTKLVFTKNLLTITSNSPETGETKVSMPVTFTPAVDKDTGEEIPFSIAFDPEYMIDACDALQPAGAEMTLGFYDELSPVRITNGAGNQIVIMPMRLS
jgi:DNA polymerase III sliding clamp (beta) subunit (PCNA family)